MFLKTSVKKVEDFTENPKKDLEYLEEMLLPRSFYTKTEWSRLTVERFKLRNMIKKQEVDSF